MFSEYDESNCLQVTLADLYEFFVTRISFYTHEELRCYKGLDAYNTFVSGWHSNVRIFQRNRHYLLICEVMHSQRTKENNLIPWAILNPQHRILSLHCTCMAGLDEACTHTATLLFYAQHMYFIKTNKSVTDSFAWWKPVSQSKNISFKRMRDVEFAVPSKIPMKYQKSRTSTERSTSKDLPRMRKEPRRVHRSEFFHRMKEINPKCVSLKIVPPFCFEFGNEEDVQSCPAANVQPPPAADVQPLPALDVLASPPADVQPSPALDVLASPPADVQSCCVDRNDFPFVYTNLYKASFEKCTYEELVCIGPSFDLAIDEEDIIDIEVVTRGQAKNEAWFRYRFGRITGYLIKETAANCYLREQKKVHFNLQSEECGFFISSENPFIGASPDKIIKCSCCGKGILEVKCPFSLADGTNDLSSLPYLENGRLSKKDAYYYQIQAEMFCTGLRYADFCVWAPSTLHIERIYFDENFCADMVKKSTTFCHETVLPELLSKYFTRHPPEKKEKKKSREKASSTVAEKSCSSSARNKKGRTTNTTMRTKMVPVHFQARSIEDIVIAPENSTQL